MVSPKDEVRYSSERTQSDRYYEDRSGHYYREVRDERDYLVNNSNGSGTLGRHSQEPTESERGEQSKQNKIRMYLFRNKNKLQMLKEGKWKALHRRLVLE